MVLASIDLRWLGIGSGMTVGGVGLAWAMVALGRSGRALSFNYRDNSRFRARLHSRPIDFRAYQRGWRLVCGFAACWGVAAVVIGLGILVDKVL